MTFIRSLTYGCFFVVFVGLVLVVVGIICALELLPWSFFYVSGIAFLIVVGLYGLSVIVYLIYFLVGVPKIDIRVEYPQKVSVGQELTLLVHVKNDREKHFLEITEITFDQKWLNGFQIIDFEPECELFEYERNGNLTFRYKSSLRPGQYVTFTYRFEATAMGVCVGDLDVWEGSRCKTTEISTLVSRI